MSAPSRLFVLLLLASMLFIFISTVLSEEQCSAPSASASSSSDSISSDSSSSSENGANGEKCSTCSCNGAAASGLPPFPELSSDAPHYALLTTYDIENCKIKGLKNIITFLHDARDYGNNLRTRYMSIDADGDPRIVIFRTEAERDLAVVDANRLTEEELKAYLTGTAAPPPTPVYEFYFSKVTLEEVDRALEYFHISKGFPVRFYPDEAAQGDLFKKRVEWEVA